MTIAPSTHSDRSESCGGRLVSTEGRTLPLRRVDISADTCGGIARVILTQEFQNAYDEPLAVTYLVPLPAEAAVSGYAFTIGGRRVVGEVDRRAAARERFEEALVDGRSAGLLEQHRSSVFGLELGNVPPHARVLAELVIDQKLAWLDEGAWEWRFPTVVAPRYMGQPGRVPDPGSLNVEVAASSLPAKVDLALTIRDVLGEGRAPESSSHGIDSRRQDRGLRVTLSDNSPARLDRDVVVRWPVAQLAVGLSIDTGLATTSGKEGLYGLLTLTPPAKPATDEVISRDLIVLLDTSGSMSGEPLDQARRVIAALIDSLSHRDRLEIIAFSEEPRRWMPQAMSGDPTMRDAALAWLSSLVAGGGTEMRSAISEALRPLRAESQRQVVLVTDGEIGFENEVVTEIVERLPSGSRLHAVGIGSAVNRSLTAAAARAGRGVEVIVGLGEDVERAAQRIVRSTRGPVVVDLEIGGSAVESLAPRNLPDLFSGCPALITLGMKPAGGTITVHGRTSSGTWETAIRVGLPDDARGNPAVPALFAREAVEDLEMLVSTGQGDVKRLDELIARFGLEFKIATRLTSFVATTEEATVDARQPTRRLKMPHDLPYGMSIQGLGLRAAGLGAPASAMACLVEEEVEALTKPSPRRDSASELFDIAGTVAARQAEEGARFDWYVSIADEQVGPMDAAGVRERWARGELSPGSLVWHPGLADWKPLSSVSELADLVRLVPRATGPVGPAASGRTHLEGGSTPLAGRVALHKGNELVIEVTVQSSSTGLPQVEWTPETDVTVIFDGDAAHATIDASRSTRPDTVAVGHVMRVVLQLGRDVTALHPRSVILRNRGQDLKIDL